MLYTRENYPSLAARFGLWPGEPRTVHQGVILARRPTGSSAADGTSAGAQGGGGILGSLGAILPGGTAAGSGAAGAAAVPFRSPDRLLLVDRRAGATLLAAAGKGSEAWRPAAGARTVTARRGQSCEAKCGDMGKRCSERGEWLFYLFWTSGSYQGGGGWR